MSTSKSRWVKFLICLFKNFFLWVYFVLPLASLFWKYLVLWKACYKVCMCVCCIVCDRAVYVVSSSLNEEKETCTICCCCLFSHHYPSVLISNDRVCLIWQACDRCKFHTRNSTPHINPINFEQALLSRSLPAELNRHWLVFHKANYFLFSQIF